MFFPAPRRDTLPLAAVGRLLLTMLLMAVALSNIIIPVIGSRWQPLSAVEPPIDLTLLGWGQEGLIVASLLLLLLGRALARGKRHAWVLSLVLFALSLLDTCLEKPYWLSLILTVSMLVLLLLFTPLFSVRSNTGSFLRGYSALALGSLCYGTALQFLRHGSIAPFLFTRADVLLVLRGLCFLVLWYGVMAILRPVRLGSYSRQTERKQTERVVRQYGHLALVYFTLSADKCYFWSKTGRSFIAYRVTGGVLLSLGDPVGPQEEREDFLRAFLTFCHQQDWCMALYQASPQTRLLCQKQGISAYKIGEEALVDVVHFTMQGKHGAAVRHAVTRAKRENVTVQCWHQQALPDAVFADMKRLSSVWMQERKIQKQFGFSMGRFPIDWSPDLLTVIAFGAQGEVQAFLTWTPLYAGEGWALDVMRRGKETAPGTMEFLIAEAIAWAKEHGYKQMSLGLAPLAGLLDTLRSSSPSFVEQSAAYLHQRGVLLGQYRSLYAFKAKFQPQWEERYLIVSERRALPQTLLALARVHGYSVSSLMREIWSAVCIPIRHTLSPEHSIRVSTKRMLHNIYMHL